MLPEEIESASVRFVERRAPPVTIPGETLFGETHYLSDVNLVPSTFSNTALKTLRQLCKRWQG